MTLSGKQNNFSFKWGKSSIRFWAQVTKGNPNFMRYWSNSTLKWMWKIAFALNIGFLRKTLHTKFPICCDGIQTPNVCQNQRSFIHSWKIIITFMIFCRISLLWCNILIRTIDSTIKTLYYYPLKSPEPQCDMVSSAERQMNVDK